MSTMPKLSDDLAGPKHPAQCQACGCAADPPGRWLEHDEGDRPTAVVVVLCGPCAGKLIEPHPRLYRELARHEPHPGAMPLCVDCRHRDGTRCAHPAAKANGGCGVVLVMPAPSVGFIDYRDKQGRRRGERRTFWAGPVKRCQQKEPTA